MGKRAKGQKGKMAKGKRAKMQNWAGTFHYTPKAMVLDGQWYWG